MGLALVAAMLMSAAIALLLERLAYRPLIKKGAPKLIILISAIGASFSLAEIMGLRDQIAGWFGLQDKLSNYVSQARNVYSQPGDHRPARSVHDRQLPRHRRRRPGDRCRPCS